MKYYGLFFGEKAVLIVLREFKQCIIFFSLVLQPLTNSSQHQSSSSSTNLPNNNNDKSTKALYDAITRKLMTSGHIKWRNDFLKSSIPTADVTNGNPSEHNHHSSQQIQTTFQSKSIKKEPLEVLQDQHNTNNLLHHPTLADAEEFLERMRRTMLQQHQIQPSLSNDSNIPSTRSETYSPTSGGDDSKDSNAENVLELKVPRSVKRIIVVRDGKRQYFDLN